MRDLIRCLMLSRRLRRLAPAPLRLCAPVRLCAVPLLCAALMSAPPPSMAQTSVTGRSATFDLNGVNGLAVHCRTTAAAGLDYRSLVSVTVNGTQATIHRVILDRTHGVYFGYDLLVFRAQDSPMLRLRFAPLSSPQSFQGADLSSLVFAPLRDPLADNTVGDRVSLDLPLFIAGVDSPVVDHLSFSPATPAP